MVVSGLSSRLGWSRRAQKSALIFRAAHCSDHRPRLFHEKVNSDRAILNQSLLDRAHLIEQIGSIATRRLSNAIAMMAIIVVATGAAYDDGK